MRIAHICLSAFYIDGYGYQENILPRVHKKMGHVVEIIASTETYVSSLKLGYLKPSTYLNEDDIQVHRLAYTKWIPKILRPKIRSYKGLRQKLEAFKPDLIFLHDIQFWDILVIREYALKYGIPVHADSHTDFINSARGFVSRYLLHGLFYRSLIRFADPTIRRYFPTLPARADFMHQVYGLSREKMELLPFGFDDTSVIGLDRDSIRQKVRDAQGVAESETVLITGGKLDLRKNIHLLIKTFSELRQAGQLDNVHLFVFGKPNPEVEVELSKLSIDKNVHLLGWFDAKELYKIFWASDAAIFPGTHSVVWEEAIAHGLPCVFHRWKGMEHLDLGGNAMFIGRGDEKTISQVLLELVAEDAALIKRMEKEAAKNGPEFFSFSRIALKAIQL